MKTTFSCLAVLLFLVWACEPIDEVITTDPSDQLSFSADTLRFDTVFTDIKTATRRLRIYNPHRKAIKIDAVSLANPEGPFTLVVNGRSGPVVDNIVVRGGDSLLVLIEATIDAQDQDNPFVIEDKLVVQSNGNQQQVMLEAWGQDAYYLRNVALACSGEAITWTKDRPYVLFEGVLVPPGCTLNVEAGTRLYMHSTAVLVVQGTLHINGTPSEVVRITSTRDFTGAESKDPYLNQPNQWGGIIFVNGSTDNRIDFTDIKNGERFQVGLPDVEGPVDLQISNSLIANMASNTFWCYKPTSLVAYNNLFINGGERLLAALGGTYYFAHNTFAYNTNLRTIRRTAAVVISDLYSYYNEEGQEIEAQVPYSFFFVNNIVSGRNEEEFQMGLSTPESQAEIHNNVISLRDASKLPLEDFASANRLISWELDFANPIEYDFRLDTLDTDSPARQYGADLTTFSLPGVRTSDLRRDFLNGPRSLTTPNVGAIEE
ncbi:hypothetical protein SAMN05421823_103424 [Catalinimonas alkaloidigena]|uniref:Right handed beta helix region n=1 Tax=Catalinimonas alkaloidigena TaxID=1075417 RepID=A0A1G9ECV9_9BACT|nr:hypothetical protein [Catalinimonas alkaloidigena]SDK73875.1 hypothetical protein SAMN05421823_103424 [Catalinimonas alkaloidigena]